MRAAQGAAVLPVGADRRLAFLTRTRTWDPFLLAVSAYLLVAVSQIQILLPFLIPLRLGLLTAGAAAALLVVDATPQRRLMFLRDPVTRGVVAMLVWAGLTIPFALHAGLAFQFVTDALWKVVLLYIVIVACIRTARDVERIALVHFAGIVAFSLYVFSSVPLAAGAARIEGIGSGSYDPNDIATFAVSGVPLAMFFASRHHGVWIRLAAFGGLAVITGTFVLTGSRGGMIAFAAVALYILLGYRTIAVRWRIGGLALAVLVTLAIGSDAYWERMRTILKPSEDYNVTSDAGRMQVWKRGIGYMMGRPITGVGVNNFGFAEGTISPLAERQSFGVGVAMLAPHNSYVQIGAELGLPGLLILTTIIFGAFRALRQGTKVLGPSDPRAPSLAQALTGSLIGVLVGIAFLSHGYTAMVYSVVALAVGYGKAGRLAAPPPAAVPRGRRRW